jgi:hypothetical protein
MMLLRTDGRDFRCNLFRERKGLPMSGQRRGDHIFSKPRAGPMRLYLHK